MNTRTKKYEQKRYEIKREANQLEYATKSEYEELFDEINEHPMDMIDEMMESLHDKKRKNRI